MRGVGSCLVCRIIPGGRYMGSWGVLATVARTLSVCSSSGWGNAVVSIENRRTSAIFQSIGIAHEKGCQAVTKSSGGAAVKGGCRREGEAGF